jgi:hypothetical protein
MTLDHIIQSPLQHLNVHPAGHSYRADLQEPGAERPAVIAAVQRQEPFLREGQRVSHRLLVRQK